MCIKAFELWVGVVTYLSLCLTIGVLINIRPCTPSNNTHEIIFKYMCFISAAEDLDFEDPPPYLASVIEQVFWCLSARVRQIIREQGPNNY